MNRALSVMAMAFLGCATGVEGPPPAPPAPEVTPPEVVPVPPEEEVPMPPNDCYTALRLSYKAPTILIVLDKSGSMADLAGKKWNQAMESIEKVVGATEDSVKWGLQMFPDFGCDIMLPSVTPKFLAKNDIVSSMASVFPAGGTPTAAAIIYGFSYINALVPKDEPAFLLLVTDGIPSCGKEMEEIEKAITAIGNSARAGVHVFIIGLSLSYDPYHDPILSLMAIAGLEPNPDGTPLYQHYRAETTDDLTKSLSFVAGKVARCTVKTDGTSRNFDELSALIDGKRVPRDRTHKDGWDAAADGASITFYGEWCDALLAGTGEVALTKGCGTI